MSKCLSITIRTFGGDFASAFNAFVNYGWEVRDIVGVSYLRAAAEDENDWSLLSDATIEKVLSECKLRSQGGKVVGIVLLHKDRNAGGSFVWNNNGVLSVIFDRGLRSTWDLSAVALVGLPLELAGFQIESFSVDYD